MAGRASETRIVAPFQASSGFPTPTKQDRWHGLYDVIDARYHTSFLLAIVLKLHTLLTGEKPQPCNAWASQWDHPTSHQAGPLTHAVT